MIALVTWTIAKVSVGFLGYIVSCSLFVCGLSGMGYSGGAMSNAPLEKPSGMISYDRLERMTRDKDMTQEKLKLAIDYADTHTKPFSLSDGQPVEAFDWRFPCAMFWGSLGTTVVGLVWFICRIAVAAINS